MNFYYLKQFSFLKLNAIIISLLEERMKIESEIKNEEKETNEEKKKTIVTDCAKIAEDFIQLQLFSIIKFYSRTYNQNDSTLYSTLISEIVIHLCLAKRLMHASHLIKTADYRQQILRKTLETFQISVAQQITEHHKIQKSYLIYDDELTLLRHLELNESVNLFA